MTLLRIGPLWIGWRRNRFVRSVVGIVWLGRHCEDTKAWLVKLPRIVSRHG